MTEQLPLFPLGTVVFPGQPLPLHVFEERYRTLVRELVDRLDDGPRRFGVVAIREGREVGADAVRALHAVGCAADLRQVTAYDDGRFDLITVGTARFRLRGVRGPDEQRPYLSGEVEWLEERHGGEAELLGASVGSLFARYRAALLARRGQAAGVIELPADPLALSYAVATAMVLDLGEKQALLAAPDAAARLGAELRLLRREAAVLRLLPSLPAVELSQAPVGLN